MSSEVTLLPSKSGSKYSTTKLFYGSFEIDSDLLLNIFIILRRICKSVQIKVNINSNESIEYQEIEEAIRDATVLSNTINSISITGNTYEKDNSISLSLDIGGIFENAIKFQARGDRDSISIIQSDIASILNANRSQFDWICIRKYIKGADVQFGFIKFLIFMGLICVAILSLLKAIPNNFGGLAAYPLFAWWIFKAISHIIAPPLIFNIGINSKKRQRRVWLISTLFGAIILGLLINIVSSIIYDKLSH